MQVPSHKAKAQGNGRHGVGTSTNVIGRCATRGPTKGEAKRVECRMEVECLKRACARVQSVQSVPYAH